MEGVSTTVESDCNTVNLSGNVLLQDLIADKILKDPVLSLEDLKQCRLVCSKWKYLTERYFRNRSTIVFRFNEYDIYDSCSLATMVYGTVGPEPIDHPFESFQFENFVPFHPPIFEEFIQSQGNIIKELIFDNVQLLISPYNFSPLIGGNLTKLTMKGRSGMPILDINFEAIKSVKYLSLTNCRVFVKDEPVKIRPKELLIENVHFEKEGSQDLLNHVLINNYFIFDEYIKKLVLRLVLEHLKYKLDVINCNVKLDTLDLQGVHLVNWDKQKWTTVKKLKLSNSSVPGSNITKFLHSEMKSKEISWLMTGSLHGLPNSVEKLVLSKCHVMDRNLILPELKYLSVADVKLMTSFSHCSNLTDLHLKKPGRGDVTQIEFPNGFVTRVPRRVVANVNDIPNSVKRLSIENIDFSGDGIHSLETLVVSHYQWDAIDILLTRLKPNNLVVSGLIKFGVDRLVKLLKCNFNQIVIGELCWLPGYRLQHSPLSRFTDKESKYYCFENGCGNPITKDQFEKFKSLE